MANKHNLVGGNFTFTVLKMLAVRGDLHRMNGFFLCAVIVLGARGIFDPLFLLRAVIRGLARVLALATMHPDTYPKLDRLDVVEK